MNKAKKYGYVGKYNNMTQLSEQSFNLLNYTTICDVRDTLTDKLSVVKRGQKVLFIAVIVGTRLEYLTLRRTSSLYS